ETALALYILQENDFEKWEGVVTDDYLNEVKNELQKYSDGKTERELKGIELFTSTNNADEIVLGAFVEWDVKTEKDKVNSTSQLFYLTLTKDGEWLVQDIKSPNSKSMEEGEE